MTLLLFEIGLEFSCYLRLSGFDDKISLVLGLSITLTLLYFKIPPLIFFLRTTDFSMIAIVFFPSLTVGRRGETLNADWII